MAKVFDDITQTIGGTPLVRLNRISEGCHGQILAKLEFFNPLSSIKDRIGLALIEAAEAKGELGPGSTIIEPTSGNTGIALAFISAVKGYQLILTMPESMSVERRALLKGLGAKLELTPAAAGMRGAVEKANSLAQKIAGSVVLQQFDNPANPAIHERTTAREIWEDTDGIVDIFIGGIGTGGSITGTGRALKRFNAELKVIGVEPTTSAVISGARPGAHQIQGIGAGFIPSNLDRSVIDELMSISDDEAFETARALAKQEGIPAGISSGATCAAALKVAQRKENVGKTIVVIFASAAERYLSTKLYRDLLEES